MRLDSDYQTERKYSISTGSMKSARTEQFVRAVVVVLNASVLVLERSVIAEPTFDHERLGAYRLAIDYVAFSYRIAKSPSSVSRPARDRWLPDAQSIPQNMAEGNGNQNLNDKNRFFEMARGSAQKCASIHNVLRDCDAIDDELNDRGKSDFKRIISMLTRLIQRTRAGSEERIEYEYKHRDAEYEYESSAGSLRTKRCARSENGFPIFFPESKITRAISPQ